MSVPALLEKLRAEGYSLRLDGERLVCRAQSGALPEHVRELLRSHKDEILAFLGRAENVARTPLPTIPRVDREGPLQLSFAQRRLWFMDQLNPRSRAYNLPAAWRLRGELDRSALQQAIDALATRHELFRSRYGVERGRPVLWIDPPAPVEVPFEDLREAGAGQVEDQLHARFAEEAGRGFDLAAGPPFRFRLFRTAEQEHHLFFMPHHIIWDAWSFDLFVREMAELYAAYAAGREPEGLVATDLQYVDYAAWENDLLKGDHIAEQVRYWQEQLQAPLPRLELPSDRPRPAYFSYQGSSRARKLPPDLIENLRRLAQDQSTTLYSGLLALLTTFFARYSGQKEFCVGCPIENTMRPELEDMFGFFVNTLVLRIPVDTDASFRQHISRVADVCLDAFQHQDVPFERLVEILEPRRELSRTPLTQALLLYQDARTRPESFGPLQLDQHVVPMGGAQSDLFVGVKSAADGWGLGIDYSSDLFDAETIDRWLLNLVELCRAAIAEPDRPLQELQAMSGRERRRVLSDWNDTSATVAEDDRIDVQIAAQARRQPDAVALVYRDQELTYRQLDERANRLAQFLCSRGLQPEDRVAVCMPRGLDMVVALLAVWRCGAAYVPIDPDYPGARIRFAVEDSAARFVLQEGPRSDSLPPGTESLDISGLAEQLARMPTTAPQHPLGAEGLAYLIYTSGSTGRPKGVMVEHRQVANFFAGMAEHLPLHPGKCMVNVTSIAFDISILEIFGALSRGMRLVVYAEPKGRQDADPRYRLPAILRRQGVHILQCTPSQARLLLSDPEFETALAHLDCLLLGGEALQPALATRVKSALRGQLWNMYGPTETTIWSTLHEVKDVGARMPIGRPILNTRVYVLDAQLRPVPQGVVGELAIAGDGVARGYWDRPELNEARFPKDPFDPREDARIYLTGDLVRLRNDGQLEYFGRNDGQIKLRGHRIELGEIENAVATLEGVDQAAAYVAKGEGQEDRLLVYYVPSGEARLEFHSARDELRASLTAEMLPNEFLPTAALPLTPNGKLDRAKMPPVPLPEAAVRPQLAMKPPSRWTWLREWQGADEDAQSSDPPQHCLILVDTCGLATALATELRNKGAEVTLVHTGDSFVALGRNEFVVAAERAQSDLHDLMQRLAAELRLPDRILHLWLLNRNAIARPGSTVSLRHLEHGVATLMGLAEAIANVAKKPVDLTLIHNLEGDPFKACALGVATSMYEAGTSLRANTVEVQLWEESAGPDQALLKRLRQVIDLPGAGRTLRVGTGSKLEELVYRHVASEAQPGLSVASASCYLIIGPDNLQTLSLALALAGEARADLLVGLLAGDGETLDRDSWTAVRKQARSLRLEELDAPSIADLESSLQRFLSTTDELRGAMVFLPVAGRDGYVHVEEIAQDLAHSQPRILALAKQLGRQTAGRVTLFAGMPELRDPHRERILASNAQLRQALETQAGDIHLIEYHDSTGVSDDPGERQIFANQMAGVMLRAMLESSPRTQVISAYDPQALLHQAAASPTSRVSARPTNEIERQLLVIWQDTLGLQDIGIHDDFFDIGGHSLTAVRIFGEIAAQYEVELPLATVFDAPTIAGFAAVVAAARAGRPVRERRDRYLVPLFREPQEDRPNVFVVAGAFGNVLNLRHLAQRLGSGTNCYGIQARGLVGEQQPHNDFVEMAQDYLDEIRSLQPEGPYHIGGFCSGGLVAMEMARLILDSGEELGSLTLLDTTPSRDWDRMGLLDRFRFHLAQLRRRGVGYLGTWMSRRLAWSMRHVRRWLARPTQAYPGQFRSAEIEQATHQAMRRHSLDPVNCVATLIRPPLERAAQLGPDRFVDSQRVFVRADNGMGGFFDELIIHEVGSVPRDHDGFVLEPDVEEVARVMLDTILPGTPSPDDGKNSEALAPHGQKSNPH